MRDFRLVIQVVSLTEMAQFLEKVDVNNAIANVNAMEFGQCLSKVRVRAAGIGHLVVQSWIHCCHE